MNRQPRVKIHIFLKQGDLDKSKTRTVTERGIYNDLDIRRAEVYFGSTRSQVKVTSKVSECLMYAARSVSAICSHSPDGVIIFC